MTTPLPRILLVEDDAVSLAFLTAAAEAFPARVDGVSTVAGARVLLGEHRYDLLLVDAHLPDGPGAELLRDKGVTPALAHTAMPQRAELDVLIAAGFAEVLVKPLSVAQLQHAIRRALAGEATAGVATPPQGAKLPVWDDAAALAALNGRNQPLRHLRRLFVDELSGHRDAVIEAFARGDAQALQARLHRLQGSCGFVAALRLASAVRVLHDNPDSASALRGFEDAVADTLAADAQPSA